MQDFAKNLLDRLYADIEPVKEAYSNDSFSYVAIRRPAGMVLLQASLMLNVLPRDFPSTFSTPNIRAGHFPLAAVGLDREAFLAKALHGLVPTPDGDIQFEAANGPGEYAGQYVPFHEYGFQTQSRLGLLSLFGRQSHEYLDQPRLDWELRGAETPYDGIVELLGEYQLGQPRQAAGIEVVAFSVASIDTASHIEGETAKIIVKAAPSIEPDKIALGFRLLDHGKVVKRQRIRGADLNWSIEEGRRVGRIEFEVPRAALIHGFVSYNEFTQQHYWVADPTTFQNPRRAAYEAFDPGLELMKDMIAKAEGKGPNADNFEACISWLFWMLGFSPALLSATNRTTDASDIVLITPGGHFAVVEVTTGLLKAERKMPNLDARANAVRRMLDSSNQKHLRVLPVLVTSKDREFIKSELPDTEKLGIYVMARDSVEAMLPRTLVPLNAEQIYEEAERAVRDAKVKYNDLLSFNGN
jgi:hypothetical protein